MSDNCMKRGRPGKNWIGPDGKTYNTLQELCKAYDINYSTVRSRLRSGLNLRDAITLKTKSDSKEIKSSRNRRLTVDEKVKLRLQVVDHKGNKFNSLKEMLKHYKITEQAYRKRYKDGWTLEEILETPMNEERKMEYSDAIDLGYRKHKK